MLTHKLLTNNYKHDYFFEFKGEKYRVHSIVKLTEKGRLYLGALKREVILTEVFINLKGKRCWKYEFQSVALNEGITNASTDLPPNKLIEEVITPATAEYASREILGIDSPVYKKGEKHTKKDWEIPEVRRGWIILIVIFIISAFFKDWYVRLIIRIVAGWIFGLYRQEYVNAYTTYTHDEDMELFRKKYEVLYGLKNNKGDINNE